MKLNKWLFGAAALAMLAACSDKDAPGGENGTPGGSSSAASGYVAVEIKLPQDVGSRADGENDQFDDGTANEYKVHNAMIVLFKGTKEKEAKFYKAQDLKKPFFTNMPSTDNITSSYIAAIPVSKEPGDNDSFWGLVILNRNEDSTDVTEDEDGNVEVTIAGMKLNSKHTFKDVLNQTTTNPFIEISGQTGDTKSYSKFFMTNAPLSDVIGGMSGKEEDIKKAKIQYLTNLGSDTYATMDEAKQHVAGCVYVERAVAKVTCSLKTKDAEGKDVSPFQLNFVDGDGNTLKNLKVDATVKFALTNTNKSSYVVRNVEFPENDHFKWYLYGTQGFRMIGGTAMPGLNAPFHGDPNVDSRAVRYRTYWCLDPNYDKPMGDENKVLVKAEDFATVGKPQYCKENTFSVKYQNNGNTTMAVFMVDLSIEDKSNPDKKISDLYTKSGDNSKIYVSKESAAAEEITRIVSNPDIQAAMKQCVVAGYTGTIDNAAQYLDIKFKNEDGYLMISSINLIAKNGVFDANSVAKFTKIIGRPEGKGDPGDANYKDDEPMIQYNLLSDINALNDIQIYAGGVSYYMTPIKHFGDFYTPWDPSIKGTLTKDVYNGGSENWDADNEHARKYLGRYGMVRNNWYDLSISNITSLGSPTIPEITLNLSDDNNEEKRFIGVEIHVLSWAKRTQNVVF